MRLLLASLALVPAAVAAVPAAAQSASAVTPGMQVVDTNGGSVGTVTAVRSDALVVKTDRHEVELPATSFTSHEGKLLFGMSQAELNAATDKSLAEAAASLVPGATVKGAGGTVVGSIDAIDADYVTIKLESGQLARIPRSGIAAGPDGAVIGLTADQLKASIGGESGASE